VREAAERLRIGGIFASPWATGVSAVLVHSAGEVPDNRVLTDVRRTRVIVVVAEGGEHIVHVCVAGRYVVDVRSDLPPGGTLAAVVRPTEVTPV
jgi:hypothetical protein